MSVRLRSAVPLVAAAVLCIVWAPLAVAQEVPPTCDPSVPASQCQLPRWPEASLRDAPSVFGAVDGTVWLDDAAGDAPPAGVDILGVGIGSVEIADPAPLRDSEAVLTRGRRKQAVREGRNLVVRVALDRPLAEVIEGYAGVHVATDIDHSRTNDAPVGVAAREQPFAGTQDVYSVVRASTTGLTTLLDSDLSRAWYRGRDPFAAAWASPTVLDFLVRPEGLGDALRVVTHSEAADGGYDTARLGVADIPLDGNVALEPGCVEASLSLEPYVVRRLTEDGQTLRNVETPASWRGGAAFRTDRATAEVLGALVAARDPVGLGSIALPARATVFEEGVALRQRPEVRLAVDGDTVALAFELGLTRRGFALLRGLELEPTGDAVADTWLARAVESLVEALPPFRVARREGTLLDAGGSCLPELLAPTTDPAAPAQPTVPGASDAPATSGAPAAASASGPQASAAPASGGG